MAIEVDHEDDSTDGTDGCNPRYIGHELDPQISRTLRLVCLTVILLMAGLELDPVALMKLSAMVLRATFIPCFVEAAAVAGNITKPYTFDRFKFSRFFSCSVWLFFFR